MSARLLIAMVLEHLHVICVCFCSALFFLHNNNNNKNCNYCTYGLFSVDRAHAHNRCAFFHKTHNEDIKMRSKHFAWHLNAFIQCSSSSSSEKKVDQMERRSDHISNGKSPSDFPTILFLYNKPIALSPQFLCRQQIQYEISYSYVC